MSKVNDGGPVHPTRVRSETDYTGNAAGSGSVSVAQAEHTGLSLRDYFAAKVLQGLVTADAPSGFVTFDELLQHYAITSYQYADAMLKERKKG